jgi:hypothetical protein
MRNSPGAHMDSETYALILGTLARNGCFREDSTPIESALEAGFSATHGPRLFDDMASEMASDIMELTEASALELHKAFSQSFGLSVNSESEKAGILEPVNVLACADEVVVDRVVIDDTTALCPRTGAKLRLFVLDTAQRKRVHDTLLQMADAQHKEMIQKPGNTKHNDDEDYAIRELMKFSNWLE